MTNFDYMKQKMAETVMGLDEMELLRLAEDTEMSASGAEGVFNCAICEEEYGECGLSICTNEHSSRYLDWCKKEHTNTGEGGQAVMDFVDFVTLVRKEVEKKAGGCCQVKLHDVRKNNGVVLKGLTVIQDGSNISPTIYLNDYYEDYTRGMVTLTNVVNDVMDTYSQNKVNESVDMCYFLNFESVKHQVIYSLVNTEKNRMLLDDVPHKEFLDLSIIFKCLVSDDELGVASILIHNSHMRMWRVTAEELYQAAEENTQRLRKHEIKSMLDILRDIMAEEELGEIDDEACITWGRDCVPMYVLSNKSRVEGAACMLYPNLISDFADAAGSSLYIIPSSVHELLLLPAGQDDDSAEIKNMIKEINDTQVSNEEILSYSLYFYDRRKGKVIRL